MEGWLFTVGTTEKLLLSIFCKWGWGGGQGCRVKIRLLKEFDLIQWILISLLLHRDGCRWLARDIALVNK